MYLATDCAVQCIAEAICSAVGSGFQCVCRPGYTGNGTTCAGIYLIKRDQEDENRIDRRMSIRGESHVTSFGQLQLLLKR